ncbi:hypothetical protein [Amycolatopsis kentuckyensis]|uniref:hypothetical protein n=1 Tax=Amycolatopsis kentuckyensis TaxID=218823 RepID=UPI00356339EB
MVAAAVAAFTIVPPSVTPVVLVSFPGVWVPAWLYEFLRAGDTRPAARTVAIWFVVGAGYAVRASVGLALAGIVPRGPTTGMFFLFAGAAWAFGIVFVTMTWALEAVGHCAAGAGGVLDRPAALAAKPHLARLLRFTPFSLRPVARADGSASSLRALTGKAPIAAPWNAGLVVAVVCAIAACASGGLPLVTVTGGLAAVFVVLMPSAPGRWVAASATVAALGLTAVSVGDGRGAVGATAVTGLFFAVYCFFRQSSYDDLRCALIRLRAGLASLGRQAGKAGTWTLVRVVGERTWALLTGRTPPAT